MTTYTMIHESENYSIESDENGRYYYTLAGAATREPVCAETCLGWTQSAIDEMREEFIADGMSRDHVDEYCRQAHVEW